MYCTTCEGQSAFDRRNWHKAAGSCRKRKVNVNKQTYRCRENSTNSDRKVPKILIVMIFNYFDQSEKLKSQKDNVKASIRAGIYRQHVIRSVAIAWSKCLQKKNVHQTRSITTSITLIKRENLRSNHNSHERNKINRQPDSTRWRSCLFITEIFHFTGSIHTRQSLDHGCRDLPINRRPN